ncbi:hypothetical protein BDB01DRAFT_849335 [Pilobolus umbonatus]|nr:hypothetical protein BDB01DRAFT_849335 [Pilobolus umbonatus]
MTTPLKIKLRLSAPKLTESPQPTPPPSIRTVRTEGSESPRKRPRPSHRNKRPKTEGTPVNDTPVNLDDDTNSTITDEASNNRRGGQGNSANNTNNTNTTTNSVINKKELLKYKDIKVRQWKNKPLIFYTLDGSEITVPSWQSDQTMNINTKASEPITVAEIDQLFASTAGEKDFRPFSCTQPSCSKSFTTIDQLQTHETNMHGTKKLVCGIDGCHKSFVTTGQLTKHRKMVHFRAARKAKLAAAAAAVESEVDSNNNLHILSKDEEDNFQVNTPIGDDDCVDISNH